MAVRVFTHPAEFQKLSETEKLVHLSSDMGEEVAGFAHLVFGDQTATEEQIRARYGELISHASRSFTATIEAERREERQSFAEREIWSAVRRRYAELKHAPATGTA